MERSGKRMDVAEREREELWESSVRRDRERRQRQLDAECYRYHADQAERLRRAMTSLGSTTKSRR